MLAACAQTMATMAKPTNSATPGMGLLKNARPSTSVLMNTIMARIPKVPSPFRILVNLPNRKSSRLPKPMTRRLC